MRLVNRVAGSIHSLPTIQALSSDRAYLVSVSERTLYLLANYASQDVKFPSRYAVGDIGETYTPISPDNELYDLFFDTVEQFQIEVTDYMTTTEAINALTNAVLGLGVNIQSQFNCGCPSETDVPITSDVTTSDPTPPAGYTDPPVSLPDYACDMANVFYSAVEKLLQDFIAVGVQGQIALGVTVINVGLQIAFSLQGPFLTKVASAIGFLSDIALIFVTESVDFEDLLDNWQANKQAIVCAVASANSAYGKRDAVNSLAAGWSTLDGNKSLIAALCNANAMVSTMYTPEEQAVAYEGEIAALVDPIDCAVCGATEGWEFFGTGNGIGDIEGAAEDWVLLSSEFNGTTHTIQLQVSGFDTVDPNPSGSKNCSTLGIDYIPCRYDLPSPVTFGARNVWWCDGNDLVQFRTSNLTDGNYDTAYYCGFSLNSAFQIWFTSNPALFSVDPNA